MRKYNPADLFESMEQVATYVNINTDFPMDSFLPFISSAVNTIVRPIVGVRFLSEYLAASDNPEQFCAVIAPLAVMLATHEHSISFGESGHKVSKNENAGLIPASDQKVEAYRDACARRGYAELDIWLQDYYEFPSGNFLTGPEDLTRFLGIRIQHPYLLWNVLEPVFSDIAQWELNKILTGDQYDSLFPGSSEPYPQWSGLLLLTKKYILKRGFLKLFGGESVKQETYSYVPEFSHFDPDVMKKDVEIILNELQAKVAQSDPDSGFDPERNKHKRSFSCIV